MTTAKQRTLSVVQAGRFLEQLCSSEQTPGVPAEVRLEARELLRHFPTAPDLERAAVAWPDTWETEAAKRAGAPSYSELMRIAKKMGAVRPPSGDGLRRRDSEDPRNDVA